MVKLVEMRVPERMGEQLDALSRVFVDVEHLLMN